MIAPMMLIANQQASITNADRLNACVSESSMSPEPTALRTEYLKD